MVPIESNNEDVLLSYLRKEDLRILDLSCGSGERGASMKQLHSVRVVWGWERDQYSAQIARCRLDRVISGDLERMVPFPFPPKGFDCIIVDALFEQLLDPVHFFRRLKANLSSTGRVICRLDNASHWRFIRTLFAGESRCTDANYAAMPKPMTLLDGRSILFEAGYRIVSERSAKDMEGVAIEALVTAASRLGVDRDVAREALGTSETVFVIEPLPPVIDLHTANLLGPAALKGTSVIILTYNSEGTIDDCLNSVVPTLGAEDELVVVDNASRDGTSERVASLLSDSSVSWKLIRNDANLGFSAGCNVGIRASRGTTICLLNPDTVVYPNWLGGLRARLDDPSVGMVGPISDYVTGMQNLANWLTDAQRSQPQNGPLDLSHLVGRSAESRLLIGFCAMFKRETLDKIGLLDEALFLGSDDLEISWRIRTHALKLMVAADVFVHHAGGQSFATEDRSDVAKLLYQSTEACLNKIKDACGWRPPDRLLWGFDITHT